MEQHDQISTRLTTAFEENIARPIGPNSTSAVTLTERDTTWLAEVYKMVDTWKTQLAEGGNKVNNSLAFDKTLVRSSFQRLLLYQELPRRYPEMTVMSDKDESTGERVVKIAKLTPEEHEADIQARRDALKQEIRDAFGFGHVFKAIIDAKKPVLGHNMFLDLAICYHHFLKPLPEDSNEFCRELHAAIPQIMDNKTIASKHKDLGLGNFDTTALGDLADILLLRFPTDQALPNVQMPPDFARYKLPSRESVLAKKAPYHASSTTHTSHSSSSGTDSAYHEAGFDALQTGVVFLNLAAFYCTGVPPSDQIVAPTRSPAPVDPSLAVTHVQVQDQQQTVIVKRRDIVHPLLPTGEHEISLMNSLNLMQIPGTFNLDRTHGMPDRRTMYVLSGLSPGEKPAQINEAFSSFGPFKISWIDSSSCVLAFVDPFKPATDAKIMQTLKNFNKKGGKTWELQGMLDFDAQARPLGRHHHHRTSKVIVNTESVVAFAVGFSIAIFAAAGAYTLFGQVAKRRRNR
jgi:hypothetical protein